MDIVGPHKQRNLKNLYVPLLIFLAIAEISCASRPAAASTDSVSRLNLPKEEPKEPFERAIWNIKMDTPLFRKYFEGGTAVVAGPGIKGAENIKVKGECLIEGNEFRVSYDIAGAVVAGKNIFCIPFSVENPANGASRTDKLFWTPGENGAGVLLSFDDDHWRTWRRYFDVFDSFGARVTFFVQGGLEPNGEKEDPEKFCLEALGRGCDLGFHSVNHYNLTKVSREIFNAETIDAAKTFSRAGISFSAFAFPFGFSEPWMRKALAPFFPLTRGYGVNTRFYDPETIAGGYIVSKAIDNIIYPDDGKFESDIRMILLAAKFTGNSIVPFTTHDISDTAQWGIKPGRLEFLLKTARELKLKFYTYADAASIRKAAK